MKILGIAGSPRKNGNSDILLAECLKGATSVGLASETIFVRDYKISGCQECRSCDTTGVCVIEDGMTRIYSKLEQADGIVVASPIFFYGLPSQLKSLIDRSQCLWARKYLLKKNVSPGKTKPGIFIGVGATKGKNLFEGVKLTIKYFFDVINVTYSRELLVRRIDRSGEILNHPEVLKQAFELGKNLKNLL